MKDNENNPDGPVACPEVQELLTSIQAHGLTRDRQILLDTRVWPFLEQVKKYRKKIVSAHRELHSTSPRLDKGICVCFFMKHKKVSNLCNFIEILGWLIQGYDHSDLIPTHFRRIFEIIDKEDQSQTASLLCRLCHQIESDMKDSDSSDDRTIYEQMWKMTYHLWIYIPVWAEKQPKPPSESTLLQKSIPCNVQPGLVTA